MRKTFLFLVILCLGANAVYAYSGGSGTVENPYQIADANDLLALGACIGDYNKHFVLTADIDLNPNLPGNHVFTTAIIAPDTGGSVVYFIGVFDGSAHKISNLTINTNGVRNGHLGLFGGSSGRIKNLAIENVAITGRECFI